MPLSSDLYLHWFPFSSLNVFLYIPSNPAKNCVYTSLLVFSLFRKLSCTLVLSNNYLWHKNEINELLWFLASSDSLVTLLRLKINLKINIRWVKYGYVKVVNQIRSIIHHWCYFAKQTSKTIEDFVWCTWNGGKFYNASSG